MTHTKKQQQQIDTKTEHNCQIENFICMHHDGNFANRHNEKKEHTQRQAGEQSDKQMNETDIFHFT